MVAAKLHAASPVKALGTQDMPRFTGGPWHYAILVYNGFDSIF